MSAIIIPARYGSTRLPAKLLEKINDKPVIAYTVEQCLKSKADEVIVATDSLLIKEVLSDYNITIIMTPDGINTGTDRIAYAAKGIKHRVVVNVQGDEPFIRPSLIDNIINELQTDKPASMVTACVPFDSFESLNQNSNVKVVLDNRGYALYFSRSIIPSKASADYKSAYRHIGIYGFQLDYLFKFAETTQGVLEKNESLEQLRALENGVGIKVLITDYKPISIDTPQDLELARQHVNKAIKKGVI